MKGSQFEPLVGRVSTRGKKVGLLFGSYQIGEKAEFVNPAFNFETGSKSAFGTSPVTDGDQEVFGRGREELKIGDIQLLHLNGLAEFNDEPERERKKTKKHHSFVSRQPLLHAKTRTRFCYCRGSACTGPYSPSIWPPCSGSDQKWGDC